MFIKTSFQMITEVPAARKVIPIILSGIPSVNPIKLTYSSGKVYVLNIINSLINFLKSYIPSKP